MWYGGWGDQDYGEYSPGQIGYATSEDGTLWLKDTENPIYGPSAPGNWDSMWTVDPEVLFDGDLYHLWYTGGVTWTGLQIGYANAQPIYESSGTYTSTLVDSACITDELVVWENLHVKQDLNGQPLTYAILNAGGQTIPGFEALSSPDAEADLNLSSLPGVYDRIYLQASFTATDPDRSAVLEEWEVSWSCQNLPYRAFLPLILRE
jgi:hypothetical protein